MSRQDLYRCLDLSSRQQDIRSRVIDLRKLIHGARYVCVRVRVRVCNGE